MGNYFMGSIRGVLSLNIIRRFYKFIKRLFNKKSSNGIKEILNNNHPRHVKKNAIEYISDDNESISFEYSDDSSYEELMPSPPATPPVISPTIPSYKHRGQFVTPDAPKSYRNIKIVHFPPDT